MHSDYGEEARVLFNSASAVYIKNRINNTHTHTRLTALCPGLPRWAGTRKLKPIWILLKQETVGGSGISWAICKSAPRSRKKTAPDRQPCQHPTTQFLQAGCPSCRPTNSVKALKAINRINYIYHILTLILSQFAVFTSWPKNGQQSAWQNSKQDNEWQLSVCHFNQPTFLGQFHHIQTDELPSVQPTVFNMQWTRSKQLNDIIIMNI